MSDRTTIALTPRPALISDDDISVDEPVEVQDDLITKSGCFPQPAGDLPIISGFTHLIRIFRLLSRVIAVRNQTRRSVSNGDLDQLSAVQDLQTRLNDGIQALPPGLNPMLNHAPALTTYAKSLETCRANILITQALARFELHRLSTSIGFMDRGFDEYTADVLGRLDL